jgi:hypothetical protein
MDNIVEIEDSVTLEYLAAVISACVTRQTPLRICTGRSNRGAWVKFARGQSMWSPPYYTDTNELFTVVGSLVVTVDAVTLP